MRQDISEVEYEKNFSFARHTTYGAGGAAKGAYYPKSTEEVATVFDALKEAGTRFTALGCGSNVLAADGNYDGVIISTKKLDGISVKSEGILHCGSGVTVAQLLKYCTDNSLGGLEYLAGIPASLGGLSYMNGGTAEGHIGDDIIKVEFYDGKLNDFSQKQCNFGNKHSTMRDIIGVICSLDLKVIRQNAEISRQKIDEVLSARRKLPKGKSCGCVFKNGDNYSAGKLIDECGLKGMCCGDAEVSPLHANFIINRGQSAADVYELICRVKRIVKEKTNVELEEEVVYIGDFNDSFG